MRKVLDGGRLDHCWYHFSLIAWSMVGRISCAGKRRLGAGNMLLDQWDADILKGVFEGF